MGTMERLTSERDFHDRQAAARAAWFAGRTDLRFSDNFYLEHETWIRPAFARLGPVAGLSVLDFGCGHGMAAIVLARGGARVTAFDLSPRYLLEARQRARANEADVAFVQANGERLPFADAAFDRVWGNAILHHLEPRTAARELHRVLKPGGLAVFCEPWGGNPLLAFARRRLPYPGKERTLDEEPLCDRQLGPLREVFPDLEIEGHQFLSMLRRVLRPGHVVGALDRCDALLLRRLRILRHFCRYVVLTLRRQPL